MTGTIGGYEIAALAASVVLGIVTAAVAIRLAGRVCQTRGIVRGVWLLVGAASLAVGLASMHAATAAAWLLPAGGVYQGRWVSVAVVCAVLSGLLLVFGAGRMPAAWPTVVGVGLLVGMSVITMQYAGLAALQEAGAGRSFDPLVAFSAGGLAVLASGSLIWFAHRLRTSRPEPRRWLPPTVAAVLGTALSASLLLSLWGTPPEATVPGAAASGARLSAEPAAWAVGGALLALLLVLIAAAIDARVRRWRTEVVALRRSEDRFRSLVQASSQIVWTTAPDGRMLEEQESWAAFTGQSFSEYRGWGWFNAVHAEDREGTARLWEETMAEGKPLEIEHRVRRHDGKYRDCVARVVPVLMGDRKIREWVGTHTDITDRARMKEDRELLAEAGRVLSSSLESDETLGAVARLVVPRIADWCVVDLLDAEGHLQRVVATHADPQKALLLQRIVPAREGEHGLAHVLRTEQSELIREASDAVIREVAGGPKHLVVLREIGLASMVSVPLLARGELLGVLTLALSDAEEHYDLRDLALAEELARRSAMAIDNARLYAEAQQAIREREEILGVVSHDLRNPLNVVTMSSELLLDLELTPEQRRAQLEIIRRSAQSMNRLIQDLLDVSRMDAGGLSIEARSEDPAEVVTEACELMRPLADERELALKTRIAAGLPKIRADRDRVQQVLSNLLGNSIKFTPSGGSIQVAADREPDGVRISVMDTGPGIPAESLPRLFDRHWQARETAHLGAGLGLAIAKAIVEAHGGRIWAESELGRGTCIHVTLPAGETEAAARQEPPGSDRVPAAASPGGASTP